MKHYTGWAMDVYPGMSEREIAHHVERQMREGANFVWIGHNNPGEVDRHKVEPALSYAVYEAYINPRDPRHADAAQIVGAQQRMLTFCLRKNIPVVFPIGYQMQMGEAWNRRHPTHLRRTFEGAIINAGGVSACFYSPHYRRDIAKYYRWVAERFIARYGRIILMVNLADEPFGGDYSHCAEVVFRRRSGMSFAEAARGGLSAKELLGRFQSNYVAQYAAWSAKAWHAVCRSIPSTMSFCGFHGREENVMPSVQALFELTPEYFHPTFDVYPRDGSARMPITQSDVTMLIILLKQLAYLSRKNRRPYWLWTTGNSWGLGQNSPDKADIADALANQFYAASTAVDNRAYLNGIAVWNYNIPNQGLYDDPNPIVYDPDEMFKKVTRMLAWLRGRMSARHRRPIDVALILSRSYGDRRIGTSRKWVRVRPFGFERMDSLAKRDLRIVVEESCGELFEYVRRHREKMPRIVFYLSDGADALDAKAKRMLRDYVSKGGILALPARLAHDLVPRGRLGTALGGTIIQYSATPDRLPRQFYEKIVSLIGADGSELYPFSMGEILLVYNLARRPESIGSYFNEKARKCHILSRSGDPEKCLRRGKRNATDVRVGHHQICFMARNPEPELISLIESLGNS